MRKALEMLGKHADNPGQWDHVALAEHYVLKPKLTGELDGTFDYGREDDGFPSHASSVTFLYHVSLLSCTVQFWMESKASK